MESSTFTTNMWAILNKHNIVIDYIVGVSYEEAVQINKDYTLIPMTPDNSPAFIGAYYNGLTFTEKEIV